MRVLVTGASGYIGGSVATALLAAGHEVIGLVRSHERKAEVQERGIKPLIGTLDDAALLADAARAADAVINAANAEHRGAVEAILPALAGSNKPFLQTSGSSIVADLAAGERSEKVYDENSPVYPLPGRNDRVALNDAVLAAARNGVRAVVICPSLIYGAGRGINAGSIQIPWLIALARKHGVPKHIGRGLNVWSNVHIDDLVDLYLLALERAPVRARSTTPRTARTRCARRVRRSAACSAWASAPRRSRRRRPPPNGARLRPTTPWARTAGCAPSARGASWAGRRGGHRCSRTSSTGRTEKLVEQGAAS